MPGGIGYCIPVDQSLAGDFVIIIVVAKLKSSLLEALILIGKAGLAEIVLAYQASMAA
jgi:hypothetical protein